MFNHRAELAGLTVAVLTLTGLHCTNPTPGSNETAARSSLVELGEAEGRGTSTEGAAATHGFVGDIEKLTEENVDFRRVVYTGHHSQLVLMSLPAGEHIGAETHRDVDQFFRVEQGTGEVVLGGTRRSLRPGSAIVVPAGTKHDVRNTGDQPLKLYTIYSPPQHRDGVVHRTRADAERDTERFDGRTTE